MWMMLQTSVYEEVTEVTLSQVLDEEGREGHTLLSLCCQCGALECAAVLIRHGASPFHADSRHKFEYPFYIQIRFSKRSHRTPLHYAAQYGRHELCLLLLELQPPDVTLSYFDFSSLIGVAFLANQTACVSF